MKITSTILGVFALFTILYQVIAYAGVFLLGALVYAGFMFTKKAPSKLDGASEDFMERFHKYVGSKISR